MLKKFRHLETDVFIYEQEDETIRLLQVDKFYPLSKIVSEEGTVKAKINCSYFTNQYVLGRNQGDLFNNTHDQEGFYDLVFLKDGSYRLGQFKSWNYKENVLAGFSVASVLNENGVDVSKVSTAIESNTKLTSRNPQTAIAVLKTGKVLLIVSDGRTTQNKGLNGLELREFIKANYDVELLCQLDGGGSSEMIVDGKIVNKPSDGKERPMFNGLALIEIPETQKAMFPLKNTWVSQPMNGDLSHKGTKAIDFGWLIAKPDYQLYAPFDGKVVWADDISKGGMIAFQSDYPVEYADGTIDYMTVLTAHDNNRPVPGKKFKQGQAYSSMGTAGGVSKHCHIEVQKGKFKSYTGTSKQQYGNVYVFPNTIEPYKALFIDDSIYIKPDSDPYKDKWVNVLKTTLLQPQERDETKNQVEVLADSVRCRKSPNGEIIKGLYCPKGLYNILEIKEDGYVWVRLADDLWIATNDKDGWTKTYLKENSDSEVEELNRQIANLNSQIQALQDEKTKLEQEHQEEVSTLTSQLNKAQSINKSCNQYAQLILNLTKENENGNRKNC